MCATIAVIAFDALKMMCGVGGVGDDRLVRRGRGADAAGVTDRPVTDHPALPPQAEADRGMNAAAVELLDGPPDPLDRALLHAAVERRHLLADRGDRLEVVGYVDPPERIGDDRQPWDPGAREHARKPVAGREGAARAGFAPRPYFSSPSFAASSAAAASGTWVADSRGGRM